MPLTLESFLKVGGCIGEVKWQLLGSLSVSGGSPQVKLAFTLPDTVVFEGFATRTTRVFSGPVNVAQQLKGLIGSVRQVEVDDVVPASQGSGTERVVGTLTFLRTDRSILVTGHLETETPATCSRCLTDYPQAAAFDIEEEFFPLVDVTTGARLPLPEEEGAFTIDERHILDMREAVRQYTLLSLPMKPLCTSDCRGLCARCGANQLPHPTRRAAMRHPQCPPAE